jgi:hypothetical protein
MKFSLIGNITLHLAFVKCFLLISRGKWDIVIKEQRMGSKPGATGIREERVG